MLERLAEIVNGDDALVRRGRYFSDTFMLEIGATQVLIEVRHGRIVGVETGPFVMRSWTFAIRATEEASTKPARTEVVHYTKGASAMAS